MKLINYGHACFNIIYNDISILFDPYKDNSVPSLRCPQLDVDALFISHEHDDHNAKDKGVLRDNRAIVTYETLKTYHDKEKGKLRGENFIHKIFIGDFVIAHLGDLGEIDDEVINFLKGVNVILCPINGFYTIGALEAIKLNEIVKPNIFIPMHYFKNGTGYPDGNQIDIFLRHCLNFIKVDKNTINIEEYMSNDNKVIIFERS